MLDNLFHFLLYNYSKLATNLHYSDTDCVVGPLSGGCGHVGVVSYHQDTSSTGHEMVLIINHK